MTAHRPRRGRSMLVGGAQGHAIDLSLGHLGLGHGYGVGAGHGYGVGIGHGLGQPAVMVPDLDQCERMGERGEDWTDDE